MPYSEKLMDHYEHPRNVGTLDKNDESVGTGMVGAPACGDVMRLQIKVNDAGVIEDAKFKTYGCGSAIASSSLVSEWVKGKTLEEAAKISNAEIAEELASTPSNRLQRGYRTMSVTLTEAAARHVSAFLTKRGKGIGLRLGVKTSGCSGMAYKLEFADVVNDDDQVWESHGVKVIVDAKSLPYIDGTELDYVREGLQEGFKYNNPQEKERCGCGKSFHV